MCPVRVRKVDAVKRLLVAVMLLACSEAFGQEPSPSIEILSKDDARAMFSMTQEEWVANVRRSVDAGIATAMGTPETGFGMAMITPEGDRLLVVPDYSKSDQKPYFIQVTVGYTGERAALMPDPALADAIETAKVQMKPEYEVFGDFERYQNAVAIFFIIAEAVR
jgi:hypothetical protein